MKVLVICIFPPVPLPEADHAFHLCHRLAEQGVELQVITNKGSVVLDHANVTQHSVMQNWTWQEMPRLAHYIKRCCPDRILLYFIGHLYDDHPMITFAPAIARAVSVRVPFVTLITNNVGASPQKFTLMSRVLHKVVRTSLKGRSDFWYGSLLHDSRRIIVLSSQHQKSLSDHLPKIDEKLILIPPPPIIPIAQDSEESRNAGRDRLGASYKDFLLIYFGYLYPTKGVETLLKAFCQASARKPCLRLALVGDTLGSEAGQEYARMLKDLTRELRIEDKVVFTGKFAWNSLEASTYLYAADACVLPFDNGVQLNNSSFAAAVTHGLPIVTTYGPALEDAFCDRQNVLLCPPNNPDLMAAAISAVINDDELRQYLRQGALQLAEEWFSWNTATKRTLAALG